MRSVLLKKLRAFRKEDDGVTLVEYGIAVTLAVAVGGGALLALSGAINGKLGQATALMP
jgi:pilus assembly protein Flp/PilA